MAGEEGRLQSSVPPGLNLPLDGEYTARMLRAFWAMLRYNPEQIKGQLPRLTFEQRCAFEMLVLDASQAPFRTNGRAWTFARNLPAQGAGSVNLIEIGNQSKSSILMLDQVIFGGASVLELNIYASPNIPAVPLIDIESRPASSTTAQKSRPRLPFGGGSAAIPAVGAIVSVAAAPSTGGDDTAFFPAGGPGPFPIGEALWPGEVADFGQVTVNIPLTITIYGRLWDFGDQLLAAAAG